MQLLSRNPDPFVVVIVPTSEDTLVAIVSVSVESCNRPRQLVQPGTIATYTPHWKQSSRP